MKKFVLITFISLFSANSAYSKESSIMEISGNATCSAQSKLEVYECLQMEVTSIQEQISQLKRQRAYDTVNVALSGVAVYFLISLEYPRAAVNSVRLHYLMNGVTKLFGVGVSVYLLNQAYTLSFKTGAALKKFNDLLIIKQLQLQAAREALLAQEAVKDALN